MHMLKTYEICISMFVSVYCIGICLYIYIQINLSTRNCPYAHMQININIYMCMNIYIYHA